MGGELIGFGLGATGPKHAKKATLRSTAGGASKCLEGSVGLGKEVNKGDSWGYYMSYSLLTEPP